MIRSKRVAVYLLVSVLILFAGGCKKKAPVPTPPPPPPLKVEQPAPKAEAPKITQFVAEPGTIERGESSTLHWSVVNATDVSIEPGVGVVPSSGTRQVFPSSSTTYALRASGPGGAASATATVNVTVPRPPPPAPPKPPAKTLAQRLESEVRDAYFDFDKYNIREDARATLTQNAEALKSIFRDFQDLQRLNVVIEGHCDERGSAEYNLGLGDRRAKSAEEFLVQLGVPADRLKLISYGKERPQCAEQNEDCWQKNRRVHFVPAQ